MKETSLITYIKKNVEDEYAMNVFYYTIKKSFVERNFSLHGFSFFFIDGRFLGEAIKVSSNANYRTPLHALGCLLSVRLLMKNHKYIKLCDDDSLIVVSKPRETFQWVNIMSLILDNWDDDEVKLLYQMIENYYYDEEFSEEEMEEFKKSVVAPEFKNERAYYQGIAQKTTGISDNVIGNNAFVEAKMDKYIIPTDIAFVGNTAFAYCEQLRTLIFEGKVMFGTFPIIECNSLERIIVPTELLSYYKENLSYYKEIISDNEDSKPVQMEEKIEAPILAKVEKRESIDTNMIQTVFDKKASSYKYFWLMAILSLAKEKEILSLSFQDITIRMAAMAWPIVYEDEIDLGSRDMIKNYLDEVVKKTTLIKAASSNVVDKYLSQHYTSQGVNKILSPLMKNVPYRFLSPWIKYTTDEEVIEKSNAKNYNGIYSLHSDHIVIDEEWWKYLKEHYLEICDFTMRSFISYAKQFNNDLKLLKLMTTGWSLIKL